MKSIGLSIKNSSGKPKHEEEKCKVELHLNLWKSLPKVRKSRIPFYLDIGIKAKFLTNEIKIYLPFCLRKEDTWSDLGHIMVNNRRTLCALFNEDYNISQVENSCYYGISLSSEGVQQGGPNPKIEFYIYTLGEKDISVNHFRNQETEGSILHIIVPSQKKLIPEYYYIRFRVPLIGYKNLALRCDLSNNLIQSAFTKLDMYNIEINEHRDIPYDPEGRLKSDDFYFPNFSKIHILYLCYPKVNVDNATSAKYDSRIIEPNEWLAYLPERYRPETYLAYHWKRVPKERYVYKENKILREKQFLKKTNLFFKVRYPKIQFWSFIVYCSVVVILGCLGSIVASFLFGGSCNFSIRNIGGLILGGLIVNIIVWLVVTHWLQILKLIIYYLSLYTKS